MRLLLCAMALAACNESRPVERAAPASPPASASASTASVRLDLPTRRGPKPRTTPSNPHTQLEQNAPRAMYEALARRLFALPGVVEGPSGVSVPGARALLVEPSRRLGPADSFMIGREFAHLHPVTDGSLHACLPPEILGEVLDKGWGEPHPMALRGVIPKTSVMLYGPRDEAELDVVMKIVEASRARAIPGL